MISNVVISEVDALLYVVISKAENPHYKQGVAQTEVVINGFKSFAKNVDVLSVH